MAGVLILTFSKTFKDPRVLRQIRAVKNLHELTVAGLGEYSEDRVKYLQIPAAGRSYPRRLINALSLIVGATEFSYWSQPRVRKAETLLLKGQPFEVIIANEISSLPLALKLAKKWKARVIFDAHEYYPGHMPQKLYFRFVAARLWVDLCRKYIPHADLCLTVSPGIAEEFEKFSGKKFHLFLSSPYFEDLKPSTVQKNSIRMIHHGGFSRMREPEKMVELLDQLDERFSLTFMFLEEKSAETGLDAFKEKYAHHPRVKFIKPVPVNDISRRIQEFDLGIFLLRIRSINNRFVLPNKFFEFVQARLPIVSWANPDMAYFIKKYDIGWIGEDFEVAHLAKELKSLTIEDIVRKKNNTEIAAKETCCEKSAEFLLTQIGKMISEKGPG